MSSMIVEEGERVLTDLPLHVDKADPMMRFYEIELSLGQILLLLLVGLTYAIPVLFLHAALAFAYTFALASSSPILLVGLWITFFTHDGVPVENWLCDLLLFKMAEQRLYLPEDDSDGLLAREPLWGLYR